MPTIVQLTPPGRGAIATALVEGPGALDVVTTRFRPAGTRSVSTDGSRQLIFGHFGPTPGEEVVARVHGTDAVELHCHGGHAAMARIAELLGQSGCTPLDWRDWARRHHPDPITADAHVALATARTQRTALVLLDQFHGALRRSLDEIQQRLQQSELSAARRQIDALLARAPLGLHLTKPWRVVLAGPPNAGKSSLINALLGYSRAIVHCQPGTTRDVVTATTAVDGWPIELCDTAGLRQTKQPVEQAGAAMAHETLLAANLVLLVFDGSQPWADPDASLVALRPDALIVHNKSDLPPAHQPSRPGGLWTSALRGDGIEPLLQTIAQRLVPDPPLPGEPIPFTADQIDALRAAQSAMVHAKSAHAAELLARTSPPATAPESTRPSLGWTPQA